MREQDKINQEVRQRDIKSESETERINQKVRQKENTSKSETKENKPK